MADNAEKEGSVNREGKKESEEKSESPNQTEKKIDYYLEDYAI
jgi:hypothetical protein